MWKREGDGPALRTEFAKRQSLNMWAAIGVCGRTDPVFFTGMMDSDRYIEHLVMSEKKRYHISLYIVEWF